MFLNIKHRASGKSYTLDIPLVSETTYPPPDFMLFNKNTEMPECRDYVHLSDSLIIHDLDDRKREYFVYFYDTDFDVADPPMYRLKKTVSKAMEIHSMFTVSADSTFLLDREGLYFIQSDTSTFSGIGIRVESDFYPRMSSINQLVEPLIYLSTKEEIDKLLNSDNIRTSFEMFWLNLAKSEEGARVVIKNFYDRIEDANLLFTNYKEGWKTDMGMIFTVLGSPDEVYRTEGKESWYYKNPGRNQIVVFNFLNIKNLYCDDHYMLIRDNQYKSFWFKGIDNWRKGID
jgi:GWxTD domain-containing protein